MNGSRSGFAHASATAEVLRWGAVTMLVHADGPATGGSFTLLEEVDPVDTDLHVHEHEDELFHVLAGDHVFRCGDEEFVVGPGGTVFAPRGVPHAHRRVVPREGRMLVMVSPPGLEGFFRELARGARDGARPDPAVYAAASQRYGITWLG
jgi:mannose-6-phosphate isomerase-like protein (cupin superfamily)